METCGEIVHLHGVPDDGPAPVSGWSVPVQVDGVRHTAPHRLIALQVGQAHDGFARLPRHVVQRTVAVIRELTATSPPGGAVAVLQVRAVPRQGLQGLLLLGGGVAHPGGVRASPGGAAGG